MEWVRPHEIWLRKKPLWQFSTGLAPLRSALSWDEKLHKKSGFFYAISWDLVWGFMGIQWDIYVYIYMYVYVLCIMEYVLCIMYYVLYVLYVLCIMYDVL